jgi:UDP-2,4-diacetamido-2,4,6-trideoxy-beta-L-altropyranose hydrolase
MKLQVRPATDKDLMLIFEWANDPLTRKMSFNQAPIPFESHKKWFRAVLDPSSTTHLFIAEMHASDNWIPVAQVRFDEDGEISMSLTKEYRGQGLATPVIQTAVDYAQNKNILPVIAHIKQENTASIKAFERAGFQLSGETSVKGRPCLEYVYRLREPKDGA